MKVCVPRENFPGEKRVAATPEAVKKIVDLGFEVSVEQNAGIEAGISDNDYLEVGAVIVSETTDLWEQADILLKVQPPIYGIDATKTNFNS